MTKTDGPGSEIPKENVLGYEEKYCWFPAGLAGTGPSGSFFEAPAWVGRDRDNENIRKKINRLIMIVVIANIMVCNSM